MATDADVQLVKRGQMYGDENGSIECWGINRSNEDGPIDHKFSGINFPYRLLGFSVLLTSVATELTVTVEASLGDLRVQTKSGTVLVEMVPAAVTMTAAANWLIHHIPQVDVVVLPEKGETLRYINAEIDTNGTPTMDMLYTILVQRA